jgi:hypothetical protein
MVKLTRARAITIPPPTIKRASVLDGQYLEPERWRAELDAVRMLRERLFLEGELSVHSDATQVRESILGRLRAPIHLEGQ